MNKKGFKFKKVLALFIALTLVIGIVPSPMAVDAAKKSIKVKSVKIKDAKGKKMKNLSLNKGQKYNLKKRVSVTPKNAKNKKVSYKTSNKKVATVTNTGNIKAVNKGTATITVMAKDKSKKNAKLKVTVKDPIILVNKVTLNVASAQCEVNKTLQLSATIAPANATNKNVEWTSSNTSIATVTANGQIKGVKTGVVTITAKAKDGSNKSGTCTVTVTAPLNASKTIDQVLVSGEGISTENILNVQYGTAESEVLASLSNLTVKGTVSGQTDQPELTVGTWVFTPDYNATTLGDYVAKASLTAPAGYKLEAGKDSISITVKNSPKTITAVTVTGGTTLNVENRTTEADVRSKLASLVIKGTVEGQTSQVTLTAGTWTFTSDYNGENAATYQVTAPLTAPTGHSFAESKDTVTISVKVAAPKQITEVVAYGLAAQNVLNVANGTTKEEIESKLATITATGVTGEETPPTLTIGAWTIDANYNGAVAGDYTAQASLTAPSKYNLPANLATLTATIRVASGALARELIVNGGFEDIDLSAWGINDTCETELVTTEKYSGNQSVLVSGRTTTGSGILQDITGKVVYGGEYQISAWIKYNNAAGPSTKDFNMCIKFPGSYAADTYNPIKIIGTGTVTKGEWTQITGTFRVDRRTAGEGLDNDLSATSIFIENGWVSSPDADNDLMDYYVDDISIVDLSIPE